MPTLQMTSREGRVRPIPLPERAMTTPPAPERPVATWLSALLPALVIAYAIGPLLSCVLMLFEGAESLSRINIVPLIVGAQAVTFVAATWLLRRIPGLWLRIGTGLQRAGWLLLATLPVLILLTILIARQDTSLDSGAATAGFFMLIIFGGYYGLQGAILLGIGALAKGRAPRN